MLVMVDIVDIKDINMFFRKNSIYATALVLNGIV